MKSSFVQLSLMMFLEYFIWGSWYVTMSTYMGNNLHSSGIQIGAAYSALAIATMISPFIVGLIADRFFAAQRIMGVLHLLGAALLFLATTVTLNGPFYWIILVYSLLYMPTIALSNSIAFNQMSDPGKQFPWIRVFGTLGWIVAGLLIGKLQWEKTAILETLFISLQVLQPFWDLSVFSCPIHHRKLLPVKLRQQGFWERRHLFYLRINPTNIFYCSHSGLYSTFILLWICQCISE